MVMECIFPKLCSFSSELGIFCLAFGHVLDYFMFLPFYFLWIPFRQLREHPPRRQVQRP